VIGIYPVKGLLSTCEYPNVNQGNPVNMKERIHSTIVKVDAKKRGLLLNLGKKEKDKKNSDKNRHKQKVDSKAQSGGMPPNF